jgi:hypothetical protein
VSSTTRRRDERGQVLAIFAGAASVIMLIAALAFDTGTVLVEKRDQQNAADAAALAGARFLPGNTTSAVARAAEIADLNGFVDGAGTTDVDIEVGSWSGTTFSTGGTNAIRVKIGTTRSSVFAGVVGKTSWDVGSHAVAVNQTGSSGPFAMLALHPTACRAMVVEGSGVVATSGNIQVNSSCNTGDRAFRVAGTGTLDLVGTGIGCNVVGGASFGGGVASNDCNPANTGATAIPDPYATLPPPPLPGLPSAIIAVSGHGIPANCPGGSSPATEAAPAKCQFGGSYDAAKTWRLFPGSYPGGLNLQGGNFLLEPGLYFIGDGGFRAANVKITSVDAGGTTTGGGVLIFNGTHTSSAVAPGQLIMQGGTANMQLLPLNGSGALAPYDNMVIYQDRTITSAVEIQGGGSNSFVRGIIYAPSAHVALRGNTGTLTVDQIIASTFEARGNGGTITVAFDNNYLPSPAFAGLVD